MCRFGTYDADYVRNSGQGRVAPGVEVVELRHRLAQHRRGGRRPRAAQPAALACCCGLLAPPAGIAPGRYDVLLVGYPGHLDPFLARLLAWFRRRPLVSMPMSLYDTIVGDRALACSAAPPA